MEIKLKPSFGNFAHRLPDGQTVLAAGSDFYRADGSFSGLGLSLQASPLRDQTSPSAEDAEMFYQAIALMKAAPKLLATLEHICEYWNGDRNDDAMHDALTHILEVAGQAIAEATTHPLQDEMEAEQREHEERADAARPVEHDDDRDHLTDDNTDFGDPDPYLYGDEDTGEDCNVEQLQCAADHARDSAIEDRLLAGGAA